MFVRSGTTWSQQAYLKPAAVGASQNGDSFGYSVAMSGDTAVVGARYEDSGTTGINSTPDESAPEAGAAYVFTGLGTGPRLALVSDGSGGYFIRFTGAPDVTYRLQRAASVIGPWVTIATLTAPASGLVEYHDTPPPPGPAFYRTVQP